jgi:hypothetical protein
MRAHLLVFCLLFFSLCFTLCLVRPGPGVARAAEEEQQWQRGGDGRQLARPHRPHRAFGAVARALGAKGDPDNPNMDRPARACVLRSRPLTLLIFVGFVFSSIIT